MSINRDELKELKVEADNLHFKEMKADSVNPAHYKKNGIETIDYINAVCMDLNGTEGFLVGNVIKYVSRYRQKNGIEDIKKMLWYGNQLLKTLENDNSN